MFRGKTYEGKWVEGVYYKQEEDYGDKNEAHIIITSKEVLSFDQALEFSVVIPETIGQYTGLTDKNGKKIFEGDILEFSDRLVVVFWHAHLGCWDTNFLKFTNYENRRDDMSPLNWENKSKIIGNIHDNPELLKGEQE